MAALVFVTLYDASQAGYNWLPAITGLFLVGGGILALCRPALFEKQFSNGRTVRPSKTFAWVFLLCAMAISIPMNTVTWSRYQTAISRLRSEDFGIVQGRVENFVPEPLTGHAMESFSVGGKSFSYGQYVDTSGFHNSSSHGGPIKEGLYVRISYRGNVILKLECVR
jgi:hypothetical protein